MVEWDTKRVAGMIGSRAVARAQILICIVGPRRHVAGSADPGDPMRGDVDAYVVAAFGLYGGPLMPRRLQNLLFLLSEDEPPVSDLLGYRPYHYGPFSGAVEESRLHLEGRGMICAPRGGSPAMSLTADGRALYGRACGRIDGTALLNLRAYCVLLNGMSHDEMLALVSLAYPEMSAKSRKHMESQDLKQSIVSLVEKEKITSHRGAELLDVPHIEIMNEICRNAQKARAS